MGLRESFLDEIDRTSTPLGRIPQPEALTPLVDRLWELPARAGLPRLSKGERQELASRILPEQPQLSSECIQFLRRLRQAGYPRAPRTQPEELEQMQAQQRQVQRLIRTAQRLERGATDGALVSNALLATLNARVLKQVRTQLAQGTRAQREALASRWDAVFLLLDRRRASQEAGRRQLERREAELAEAAAAAERTQAVARALEQLRALLSTPAGASGASAPEGGRP
ncbi:MAG: hypothetical protein RMK29_19520 [Myxococcales bacterium]|nr:hypothetical protein [Myxococcota bacterium]MDW8283897.1 hypothetical protein [Myxococcales bacterium]